VIGLLGFIAYEQHQTAEAIAASGYQDVGVVNDASDPVPVVIEPNDAR
jgi:hypothetical protein